MATAKKNRYKQAKGRHLIEVSVRSPQQLFDAHDPAPFRERDLDEDFIEYVVSAAREISSKAPMSLIIHIQEPEKKELSRSSVKEAIHEYLNYRIERQRKEFRMFIRRAQVAFMLGLVTLTLFLSIAQSLRVPSPPGFIGVIREGLIILGWVSVWKPVELMMFDWYPLIEVRKLFQRLLESEIEVHFAG